MNALFRFPENEQELPISRLQNGPFYGVSLAKANLIHRKLRFVRTAGKKKKRPAGYSAAALPVQYAPNNDRAAAHRRFAPPAATRAGLESPKKRTESMRSELNVS